MDTIYLNQNSKELSDTKPCVLALGFFDGVHIGHRRVINEAKYIAKKRNLKLAVLTFSPHPRQIIQKKEQEMEYLTPLKTKKKKLHTLGVDILYVIKFDLELSKVQPKKFVEEYLIPLNVKHVVAGFDFTYGHKALGNMSTIKDHGAGRFRVTTTSKVEHKNQKISSTLIRNLLDNGEVELANKYLGNYYQTTGFIKSVFVKNRSENITGILIIHSNNKIPKKGLYNVEININNYLYKGTLYNDSKKTVFCKINHFNFINHTNIENTNISIDWLNHVPKKDTIKEYIT